jgi:hypothetical protein
MTRRSMMQRTALAVVSLLGGLLPLRTRADPVSPEEILRLKVEDAVAELYSIWGADWQQFTGLFGDVCRLDPVFAARVFNGLWTMDRTNHSDNGTWAETWEDRFAMFGYALSRGGVTAAQLRAVLSARATTGEYVISASTAAEFLFNWARADGGQMPWKDAIRPLVGTGRSRDILAELNLRWGNRRTVTQWRAATVGSANWREFFEPLETLETVPLNNVVLVFRRDFETLLAQAVLSDEEKAVWRRLWSEADHGAPLRDQFFLSLVRALKDQDPVVRQGAVEVLEESVRQQIVTPDSAIDLTVARTEAQGQALLAITSEPFTRAALLSQQRDEAFLATVALSVDPVKGTVLNRQLSDVELAAIVGTGLTESWYRRLSDREERAYYIRRILAIDTTNERPYIATGTAHHMNFICTDFSMQLWMNGRGMTFRNWQFQGLLLGERSPEFSYGLPIHVVRVWQEHMDHAIDAFFIGDDIRNDDQRRDRANWLIAEPATDEIPQPMELNVTGPVYGVLPYQGHLQIGPWYDGSDVFSGRVNPVMIWDIVAPDGLVLGQDQGDGAPITVKISTGRSDERVTLTMIRQDSRVKEVRVFRSSDLGGTWSAPETVLLKGEVTFWTDVRQPSGFYRIECDLPGSFEPVTSSVGVGKNAVYRAAVRVARGGAGPKPDPTGTYSGRTLSEPQEKARQEEVANLPELLRDDAGTVAPRSILALALEGVPVNDTDLIRRLNELFAADAVRAGPHQLWARFAARGLGDVAVVNVNGVVAGRRSGGAPRRVRGP